MLWRLSMAYGQIGLDVWRYVRLQGMEVLLLQDMWPKVCDQHSEAGQHELQAL